MFLTPRKTPLVKKDDKEATPVKAVRTIPSPRPGITRMASKQKA